MLVRVFAVSLLLAGCATTHTDSIVDNTQYCYTDQEIVTKNGNTITSQTRVECSDRPDAHAKFENGYDSSRCGWARQSYPLAGRIVVSHTMACKLDDGSWTYVPNHLAY